MAGRPLILAVMLCFCPALAARDAVPLLPDLDSSYGEPDAYLKTRPNMSRLEYDQAIQHNKRLLLHAAGDYLKQTLASLGMPKTAREMTGTALGLFLERGAKLHLNGNKTMSVQLDNLDGSDRSIYYKFNYSW